MTTCASLFELGEHFGDAGTQNSGNGINLSVTQVRGIKCFII